jgi:hypothetical protein
MALKEDPAKKESEEESSSSTSSRSKPKEHELDSGGRYWGLVILIVSILLGVMAYFLF